MFRAEGVFQALGMRGGLQRQAHLRRWRPGGGSGVLSALMMPLQGVAGEVMVFQDTLNPTVSDWHVVAVLDNLRQLVQSKRVGDGQPDDLLLDMVGQQRFDRWLAPWMR